ncbi:hypothetical protein DINM_005470 [Dirofilaria immitis]|nr:hypothetical protein [Dirofilaria immitis]
MLLNRLIFVHRGGGIRLKSASSLILFPCSSISVYVRDIQEGTCMKDSIANILKEHTASVYISDGSNLLGPMIIIDRIISELPVGTSMGCIYEHIMDNVFNSIECSIVLGTNPLTFAAKAKNDTFVLHMATTTVAVGKIEIATRKKQTVSDT